MEFTHRHHIPSITFVFVLFFMLFLSGFSIEQDSYTFSLKNESKTMKMTKTHLKKTNKPFVKSIQSPDGDIIDCVLTHLQPAFDRPELKRLAPLDEPEPSNLQNKARPGSELKQTWNSKGESCPYGTIPIRRTNEVRTIPVPKIRNNVSKQIGQTGDEFAIVYKEKEEEKYYGARAALNVWDPIVTDPNEFSTSQVWVAAVRTRDLNDGDNFIEAGWMVNPKSYGDNSPRFFVYWTTNRMITGCYNLLCSGFVQMSNKILLGGAIAPVSTYNSTQIEIGLFIWRSPKYGVWWLKVGSSTVGYWPATIFTHLQEHATFVGFGGKVRSATLGGHTSTQMGSGHFPNEGLGKATYIRHMEVIDEGFMLHPMFDLHVYAKYPDCYDVINGTKKHWGSYIFFGGPGTKNNPKCTW